MGFCTYRHDGWRKVGTFRLHSWWLLDTLQGRHGARHGRDAWLYLMTTEGLLLPDEML